jgi:hypothetical protein
MIKQFKTMLEAKEALNKAVDNLALELLNSLPKWLRRLLKLRGSYD